MGLFSCIFIFAWPFGRKSGKDVGGREKKCKEECLKSRRVEVKNRSKVDVGTETERWHQESSLFGVEMWDQTEALQFGTDKATQTGNENKTLIRTEEDKKRKGEKEARMVRTEMRRLKMERRRISS